MEWVRLPFHIRTILEFAYQRRRHSRGRNHRQGNSRGPIASFRDGLGSFRRARRMLPNTFHRIALAFTLALCSASLAAKQSATLAANNARKPAPDFALTDATGAPLQLSAFKGKVVVLDFWATWCHGCKTEIPWYMEFQKKYKSQSLVVIGVSMDEDGWKSVRPYLAKHPINYPITIGNPA